jgi:hypothetical protein
LIVDLLHHFFIITSELIPIKERKLVINVMTSTATSPEHEHILEIQERRRGIIQFDKSLPSKYGDDDSVVKSYQGLLKMISTGQYSGPERLYFELLQNCEDAPLADPATQDGLTVFFLLIPANDPRLKDAPASLAQNNGVLILASDEAGFSERNVTSICTAAISSKASTAASSDEQETRKFIGEKGIGFKSVYGYSDSPHIFSGKYRFHFKPTSEDNQMAMVTPYWIDNAASTTWIRDLVHSSSRLFLTDVEGTAMTFPLKEGVYEKLYAAMDLLRDCPENIEKLC